LNAPIAHKINATTNAGTQHTIIITSSIAKFSNIILLPPSLMADHTLEAVSFPLIKFYLFASA
jgi:hypothetical protein